MDSKRILCVIESLESGGAQRQLIGLAHLLKDNDYSPKIITYYSALFYKDEVIGRGLEYECLGNVKNKLLRFFLLMKTILREKPYGVISYSYSSSMILCLIRLFVKFKLIVSERNTSVSYTLRDKIKFNCFRLSDAVVANSNSQSSFIKKHAGFLSKKTHTITNYVDCTAFKPRNIEKTEFRTNTLIGVGRIVAQKNIVNLIKALGILKRKNILVKVDWYGSVNKEYLDLCVKTIKEEQVEDVFTFKKVDKNIKDTYGKYEALCLPSIYEGFPNVICEAMSCGLPILCGNVCDNGVIVENGKNGLLFDPTDINSICDSISHFVNMTDEEKREISQLNRQKALVLFSKDVFIKKYIDLIEQ